MVLALTLVYGQCTTDVVGSYIGTQITKTSMVWCTIDAPPMELALTLVPGLQKHRWCWLLHQCTTGAPPMELAFTLEPRLQKHQWYGELTPTLSQWEQRGERRHQVKVGLDRLCKGYLVRNFRRFLRKVVRALRDFRRLRRVEESAERVV